MRKQTAEPRSRAAVELLKCAGGRRFSAQRCADSRALRGRGSLRSGYLYRSALVRDTLIPSSRKPERRQRTTAGQSCRLPGLRLARLKEAPRRLLHCAAARQCDRKAPEFIVATHTLSFSGQFDLLHLQSMPRQKSHRSHRKNRDQRAGNENVHR